MKIELIHTAKKIYSSGNVLLWLSGWHLFIISFNKVTTDALRRFTSCGLCFGGLQWWENLAMAPPGISQKNITIITVISINDLSVTKKGLVELRMSKETSHFEFTKGWLFETIQFSKRFLEKVMAISSFRLPLNVRRNITLPQRNIFIFM